LVNNVLVFCIVSLVSYHKTVDSEVPSDAPDDYPISVHPENKHILLVEKDCSARKRLPLSCWKNCATARKLRTESQMWCQFLTGRIGLQLNNTVDLLLYTHVQLDLRIYQF